MIAIHTWISQVDNTLKWQGALKKRWIASADRAIAVSDALKQEFDHSVSVFHNPYDDKLFKILPGIERNKDFVFLGRLVSDKGANLAIEAINELKKQGLYKKLTIIGDGPELDHLKKLVAKFGLNDSVSFKGNLRGNDLVKELNRHHFILVPSIWEEPFGLVALEGMASGCIPIVSHGGGLPEAIGKAGITFTRGDLNSLVINVKHILSNKERQRNLRSQAISHLENHTTELISKQYVKAIKTLI